MLGEGGFFLGGEPAGLGERLERSLAGNLGEGVGAGDPGSRESSSIGDPCLGLERRGESKEKGVCDPEEELDWLLETEEVEARSGVNDELAAVDLELGVTIPE